jgi:hypothetical protein
MLPSERLSSARVQPLRRMRHCDASSALRAGLACSATRTRARSYLRASHSSLATDAHTRCAMASAAPLDSAAAAAPAVVDFFPFAALPPALALKIFAALPVDTRLRCAEVCTAWCAAVAERSLWTRLDLSRMSGVTHAVTPALLRAAAAKARGALAALDVSGLWQLYDDGVLREVLAANAGTLRELRCLRGRDHDWITVPDLAALLSVAPQLRVCEADVWCDDAVEARCATRECLGRCACALQI